MGPKIQHRSRDEVERACQQWSYRHALGLTRLDLTSPPHLIENRRGRDRRFSVRLPLSRGLLLLLLHAEPFFQDLGVEGVEMGQVRR